MDIYEELKNINQKIRDLFICSCELDRQCQQSERRMSARVNLKLHQVTQRFEWDMGNRLIYLALYFVAGEINQSVTDSTIMVADLRSITVTPLCSSICYGYFNNIWLLKIKLIIINDSLIIIIGFRFILTTIFLAYFWIF